MKNNGEPVGMVETGQKPVIIEKEKVVGGLCRSLKTKGFTFDLGGHRFLPGDEKIIESEIRKAIAVNDETIDNL